MEVTKTLLIHRVWGHVAGRAPGLLGIRVRPGIPGSRVCLGRRIPSTWVYKVQLGPSGAMLSPNPIKFIGIGAMDVTKPYKFIGLGAQPARPTQDPVNLGWQGPGLALLKM